MDPPISPEAVVRPPCQRPNHSTGYDRFRQIFCDHWEHWVGLRLENEVPTDQRAYINKIVLHLMLCRYPEGGYAQSICPGCQFEHRVSFLCKTRFSPSCSKVKVDNWVRILQEAERCPQVELAALLRCEGIYSNHFTHWRR